MANYIPDRTIPLPASGAQLRERPKRAELIAALWEMSVDQRVAAMRRGELSYVQLCAWSSARPHEVPLLNGEFEFIAASEAEAADAALERAGTKLAPQRVQAL